MPVTQTRLICDTCKLTYDYPITKTPELIACKTRGCEGVIRTKTVIETGDGQIKIGPFIEGEGSVPQTQS